MSVSLDGESDDLSSFTIRTILSRSSFFFVTFSLALPVAGAVR